MEISTCRPPGGLYQVPYTAIREYADREDVLDFPRFHALIRRMDHTVLSAQTERMEKERAKTDAKTPTKKGRR